MQRFLITTADTRSWRSDRPVLFLGEWCRLYSRPDDWRGLDAEVVPYHWDDRTKYYEDCIYLQNIYEDALRKTSDVLNQIHQSEHSLRYWRILIGPWLYMFIHTLFDRWTIVKRATSLYEIDGTVILNFPPADMIPTDLKAVDPDNISWNHYLFGKAIKYQKKIRWTEIQATGDGIGAQSPQRQKNNRKDLFAVAHAMVSWALGLFTRSNEAMVVRSYLPITEEIKLQIALGQVPKLWKPPRPQCFSPDTSLRQRLKISGGDGDSFCDFLYSMIPEQIPTVYLEGYRNLVEVVSSLHWPSRPRVIFTSNLFFFCEVFQAWAAEKAESGSPLVFGQHGGLIGIAKWLPGEDHQVQIADRYLTWGWQDERSQIYPAVALTNVNKPLDTWNPEGNLLLVTAPMRLFSYKSCSWPVGPNQSVSFVGEQLRFVQDLTGSIRPSMVLRIDKALDKKMQSFYVKRWEDAFPDIEIDGSNTPLEHRLRKCRIFVYTYNSTGFLETLSRNIPTVIFWNPKYFELRPSARPYFDQLRAVGIFHETPESAAIHINRVWDDVVGWWNQPSVQETRRSFCEQYARRLENPLRALKTALVTVSAGSATN